MEEGGQFAFALEKRVEASCQERACRIRLVAHGPVQSQPQQQLIVESAHSRIVGLLDLHPLATAPDILLAGEKGRGAADELVRASVVMDNDCIHADILPLAFEDQFSLRKRRSALPFLDDARVTRTRKRIGAELGSHVKPVAIPPRHLAFGLRQIETVFDERLGFHVELPHHLGIRAASREEDQAAVVSGIEDLIAFPDPVLLLGGGHFVEVGG